MRRSNNSFAEDVMAIAGPIREFKPCAFYNRDGDCIESFFQPDDFYAERVDDLLTVYYSEESGELIGSVIKGVSQVFRDSPVRAILVDDGRVKISHLFVARASTLKEGTDQPHIDIYRKLIKYAEQNNLNAELQLC